MRGAEERRNNQTLFCICGKVLRNIRYADDITLLVRNKEELSTLSETQDWRTSNLVLKSTLTNERFKFLD